MKSSREKSVARVAGVTFVVVAVTVGLFTRSSIDDRDDLRAGLQLWNLCQQYADSHNGEFPASFEMLPERTTSSRKTWEWLTKREGKARWNYYGDSVTLDDGNKLLFESTLDPHEGQNVVRAYTIHGVLVEPISKP